MALEQVMVVKDLNLIVCIILVILMASRRKCYYANGVIEKYSRPDHGGKVCVPDFVHNTSSVFLSTTNINLLEQFVEFCKSKNGCCMLQIPEHAGGAWFKLFEIHNHFLEQELEESWEDEILYRTREFNKMCEYPHDEKVWLAFAQFQDKVASTQPQKAAHLQTTERKISILEKVVELNPDSEELLLCLLKSYGKRDSTETLLAKWEQILANTQIAVSCGNSICFYAKGNSPDSKFLKFGSPTCMSYRLYLQLAPSYDKESMDSKSSSLVQLQVGLVDIFVNLCRFEWQIG